MLFIIFFSDCYLMLNKDEYKSARPDAESVLETRKAEVMLSVVTEEVTVSDANLSACDVVLVDRRYRAELVPHQCAATTTLISIPSSSLSHRTRRRSNSSSSSRLRRRDAIGAKQI